MNDNDGHSASDNKAGWNVLIRLVEAAIIGIVTTVLLNYTTLQVMKEKQEAIDAKLASTRAEFDREIEKLNRDIDKLRTDLYEPRTTKWDNATRKR